MNENDSVYHVLLQRGAPSDWQSIAAMVSECAPKISKGLIAKACRFGNGMIALGFKGAETTALVAKLQAAGIAAVAIEVASVVQPPRPYTVLRMELQPEVLAFQVGTGPQQTVPWTAISILHVGCVRFAAMPLTRGIEEVLNEGDDAGADVRSFSGNAGAEPRESEVLLELFTIKPLIRLRIRQNKFSYDFLGERRQPTGRANFALVLAELKARAPGAATTGLFPFASGGRKVDVEKFGMDEREYEQQVSALLTIESQVGLVRG